MFWIAVAAFVLLLVIVVFAKQKAILFYCVELSINPIAP